MSIITILSKQEEKLLDEIPKLNFHQIKYFFKLPSALREKIDSFDNDMNKGAFICMYGYFKVTNYFFTLEEYNKSNIEYISQINDINFNKSLLIDDRTIRRYKKLIKNHLGINEYTQEIENRLKEEAISMAHQFIHHKKIFYSLFELSRKLKIETPSYTELSIIITAAVNSPKKEILNQLKSYTHDEILKHWMNFYKKMNSIKIVIKLCTIKD